MGDALGVERLEKLSYQAGYRFSAQVLVFASEQPITLEQAAALDGLPLHVAMQHVQLQRQDVKAAVHTGSSPVLVAVLQAARGESAREVRLAHLGLRARSSDTMHNHTGVTHSPPAMPRPLSPRYIAISMRGPPPACQWSLRQFHVWAATVHDMTAATPAHAGDVKCFEGVAVLRGQPCTMRVRLQRQASGGTAGTSDHLFSAGAVKGTAWLPCGSGQFTVTGTMDDYSINLTLTEQPTPPRVPGEAPGRDERAVFQGSYGAASWQSVPGCNLTMHGSRSKRSDQFEGTLHIAAAANKKHTEGLLRLREILPVRCLPPTPPTSSLQAHSLSLSLPIGAAGLHAKRHRVVTSGAA